MKSQREKVICNYFDPHKSMDVVDMYSWLAPDITIFESEKLPWGGQYRGLKGVGEYLTNVTRNIISEIKLEEVYSCGEKVVAIGRSNGKVRATGNPFDIRVIQLFTFNENDKISRVEFLADLQAFQAVLAQDQPASRTSITSERPLEFSSASPNPGEMAIDRTNRRDGFYNF